MTTTNDSLLLYWSALLLLTLLTLLSGFLLIPFLFAGGTLALYLLLALLGLFFGYILHFLVQKTRVSRAHHLFAAAFVPLIGVISILLVVNAASTLAQALDLGQKTNAPAAALVYLLALLGPTVFALGAESLRKTHNRSR